MVREERQEIAAAVETVGQGWQEEFRRQKARRKRKCKEGSPGKVRVKGQEGKEKLQKESERKGPTGR